MKFKEDLSSLRHFDLSKAICNHLVGDHHTRTHRYSAGICIMAVGVGLTKVVLFTEIGLVHAFGDLIGYGVHGIGAIPFVDSLISKHKDK